MVTHVLYMEDDPGLSILLQKGLTRKGFVVDTAVNGEDGLQKVAAGRFDVLLVDYNMPFLGGLDVIRILGEQGSSLPIIMVTGEGNESLAVEALKLGAADYVVKDAEMRYLELLPAVIGQVLYKQQLVKEHRTMQENLRESEERYRRLVELSPDGIAIHSKGRFSFVNPAGVRILGAVRAEQLTDRSLYDVVHPDYQAIVRSRMQRLEAQPGSAPWIEEKFIRIDGAVIDVEVASISFSLEGKLTFQTIFRDITERKQVEQRLEHLALYDPLTGLPNRALFFDRMGQLLSLAKRNHFVLALLYMDLDHFKKINDTLGHEAGDLLLQEASKRMASSTRRADTIARMGGDEFIGICGRITAAEDAVVVARKIVDVLSEPFDLKGHRCSISASIGISLYPADGDDAEILLNKADQAMYRVKQGGKGGYLLFRDMPAATS
ncbi:MAG: diguanylate cyclase [Nitrospirae bacterium GWC2_56_14]|nr:MAG: diguanylate cyclase [Nitrospirae bacterium GWC2_56_14]